MPKVVSHRPLTVEVRIRPQVRACEISDGQSGTGTGFAPITSVFPCQYHSTNSPYSFSSTCCSYQDEAWEPFERQCSFANRGALERKLYLHVQYNGLPICKPYSFLLDSLLNILVSGVLVI
jgi:hypothetical protein